MSHKPEFNWGLSFGNVVQIILLCAGMIGMYYKLVQDVELNAKGVAENSNDIKELRTEMRDTRSEILEELKENLTPIRDDVRWLVRREAEKHGD